MRSKWAAGKAVRAGLADALWAGASWLFFRVARSTRMTKIWALRQSGSDRLEKQPTDLRQNTSYFGDRTLETGKRYIQNFEHEIGVGVSDAHRRLDP